jgi:DNA repair protein RadC
MPQTRTFEFRSTNTAIESIGYPAGQEFGKDRRIQKAVSATSLDTPLNRVQNAGFAGASITDLLAVAISPSEGDQLDAEIRARELLRGIGSLQALADLSSDQLRMACGEGDYAVARHLAWLELGRRTSQAGKGPQTQVMSPSDVSHLLRHLRREKREHFIVVLLDAKNNVMRWSTIHIGTLTMSVVGPREVFREAIREGASSIIVAHNHPSGDPEPSPEDIRITQKLEELGSMLDIKLWDHVILGDTSDRWVSLRQRGVFSQK